MPCGADTHQHAPHHSCGQGSPVPQGEEPTAETSGIVVVGTQPGAALSALIKPSQPQACKFSLTPFKSKLWNCTWATFGCVPKLPMVMEKRSPDHSGFPLASSLPLLETAATSSHVKPGWGTGHYSWLSSPCKMTNCSLLLSCTYVILQAGKAAEMAVSCACPCTGSPLPIEAMAQRFTPAKSFEASLLKANLFLFQKILIIEKPGFCWLISLFFFSGHLLQFHLFLPLI